MSPPKPAVARKPVSPSTSSGGPRPDKAVPSGKAAPEPEAKPYHHGNLRESLLEAADVVLARQGAAGITLRDVAKQAGVSHAAPYHHFASLDDMLAAVAERGFMRLAAAMSEAPATNDPREQLLQISEAYVNCARANPAQFRLMFGPLLARKREYPALQVAAEHAFGCLLTAATAHDPENGPELALVGWSLAHGLSNLLIDGALDGLPMQLPAATVLARQLGQRALGSR